MQSQILTDQSNVQITRQKTFNMEIFVENRFSKFWDEVELDIVKEAWKYQYSPQETGEESFFEDETTYYSGATVDCEQTRRMVNRQYVCRQNRPRHASFPSFELFSFVLPSPLFLRPFLKSQKDTLGFVCFCISCTIQNGESLRIPESNQCYFRFDFPPFLKINPTRQRIIIRSEN